MIKVTIVFLLLSFQCFADKDWFFHFGYSHGDGMQDQGEVAIKENASGAALGQMGVSIGNNVVAGSKDNRCCALSNNAKNCIACPLLEEGLAAVAVGSKMNEEHSQSGADAVSMVNAVTTSGGQPMTSEQFSQSLPTYQSYDRAVSNLKEMGISLNKKTGDISLPNGNTITPKDANSTQKLSQLMGGKTQPSVLDHAVQAVLNKAKSMADVLMKNFKEEKVLKVAIEPSTEKKGDLQLYDGYFDFQPGINQPQLNEKKSEEAMKKKNQVKVDGLRLRYGDSYVGVKNEDIFKMMNRYYQNQIEKNTLLKK